MADQFVGLLWGNLMLGLLLAIAERPSPREIAAARGSRDRGVPARLSAAPAVERQGSCSR